MSITISTRTHHEVQPRPALGADLIVVGGVPGAGKTTAIRAATREIENVAVLDPDRIHRVLREHLPAWVPYRSYRLVVHVVHTLTVLGRLLLGPVPARRLVIHDPGTRRRRRRLFLTLADLRGWRTALVYVDADRSTARSGQFQRGRTQRPAAFARHWDRWQQLREGLGTVPNDRPELLVDRDHAATVLRSLCLGVEPSATYRSTASAVRRAA